MNNAEFQLQRLGDPRLAVHATSPRPAWLWSTDGARILWANPVGAQLFGAGNGASLAKKSFRPGRSAPAADRAARRPAAAKRRGPAGAVARLRRRAGHARDLRLFAARIPRRRPRHPDHGRRHPAGRTMPLVERLQRLVQGVETPIAAFARDGMFIGASDAARPLLGFRNLSEAGLDEARERCA